MIDDEGGPNPGQMYRLAWRFRRNGTTGTGPWMRDREIVDAWLESLSRRSNEDIDHWVETAPVPRQASRDHAEASSGVPGWHRTLVGSLGRASRPRPEGTSRVDRGHSH